MLGAKYIKTLIVPIINSKLALSSAIHIITPVIPTKNNNENIMEFIIDLPTFLFNIKDK